MARIAGRANVGLSITGGTGGIDLSASQIDSIPLFPVGSVATQPDSVAVVTAVPASERSERHLAKRVARRAGALARGDALMLVVAVMLAEFGAARAGIPHTPVPVLVAFVALVLALFGLRGMYRPRPDLGLLDDVRAIFSVTALAAMMLVSARVFFSDDSLAAQQGVGGLLEGL